MIIVGIDEVGRGCWAGPLVAGAVILNKPILGLKDSKKLTKKQREKFAADIHLEAVAIGLGWVWPEEIDISGITTAVKTAMERAIKLVMQPFQEVIIDGNMNFLSDYCFCKDVPCGNRQGSCKSGVRVEAVIKADDTVGVVSAASIVAKVARDKYMAIEAVKLYPEYGFDKHVGYGTPLHIAMLKTHGVTSLHRKSYKPIQQILLQSSA